MLCLFQASAINCFEILQNFVKKLRPNKTTKKLLCDNKSWLFWTCTVTVYIFHLSSLISNKPIYIYGVHTLNNAITNCIILRQNDLVQDLGVFSEIMKYQNPIKYISLIYIQFNCKTLTSNLENCKELYIQQGTLLAATCYHFHHLKYFRKSGQKVVTEI